MVVARDIFSSMLLVRLLVYSFYRGKQLAFAGVSYEKFVSFACHPPIIGAAVVRAEIRDHLVIPKLVHDQHQNMSLVGLIQISSQDRTETAVVVVPLRTGAMRLTYKTATFSV